MFQENNYPRAGLTRTVDTEGLFFGTAEEVMREVWEAYNGYA